MNTGDTVVHPQWGKGTVLFDRPHCIGVRFIEHGQVNFSQEEWLAQKSPPERFRGIASKGGSAMSELEYTLQEAVENTELTEEQAERMLREKVHPFEVQRARRPSLVTAYQRFLDNPKDEFIEEDFYTALLGYVTALVKRSCHDSSTFPAIEDAIQESVLEVWKRLSQFDPTRSSFLAWVAMITTHNVRDLLRQHKTSRGLPRKQPDPAEISKGLSPVEENMASESLPVDVQFFVKEYLERLSTLDRSIVQMATDGLTLREIGAALDLSHEGVRRRLKKLRIKLTKVTA